MTCIVGYVDKENKKVYIGGDSLGVHGTFIVHRKDPKVFINKNFIIGFTNSFRMGQILMSSKFNPPDQLENQTDFDYMITSFIDHIRDLFDKNGFMTRDKDEEKGGNFLVGYRGNLYEIEDDYQVAINCDDYNAVGCGYSYALGALVILKDMNLCIEDRIKKAIEAAIYLNGGVGGEIKILSL